MANYLAYKIVIIRDVDSFIGFVGVPAMHPFWGRSKMEMEKVVGDEISYSTSQKPLKDQPDQYWWFRVSPSQEKPTFNDVMATATMVQDHCTFRLMPNPREEQVVLTTVYTGDIKNDRTPAKYFDLNGTSRDLVTTPRSKNG